MGDSLVSSNKLNESPAVEVTGKIMVLAIIILFMVVVFVLFLHLYAKWFWWSIEETAPPPPRRRRRRRFVFAPGQDPAIYGGQRSGIDPSVLLSLPVLIYQPENFKDGLECAVCLSELAEGEKARLLPKCNHGFHVDCIDMWFQSHSTCPLCRNPVASETPNGNNNPSVRESSAENIGGQSQASENLQSPALAAMSGGGGSESPNFPTNVLVWGNQTQVSSINTSSEEEGPSSSSTTAASSSSNNRRHEMQMMVIDMPSEVNSSSLSPASGFAEDELKSPMTTRLRSLKRLLSRDKRFGPCSPGPGSIDVEQAGRGHC